jgi:hypothetical protein
MNTDWVQIWTPIEYNHEHQSVADLEGGPGAPLWPEIYHQMIVKLKIWDPKYVTFSLFFFFFFGGGGFMLWNTLQTLQLSYFHKFPRSGNICGRPNEHISDIWVKFHYCYSKS